MRRKKSPNTQNTRFYVRGLRLGEARGESASQKIYFLFLRLGRRIAFFELTGSVVLSTWETHRNGCEATAFVRCQWGAKRVVVLYPMSPRSCSPRRRIHLFASIFFAAKQLRRKVRCRWWSVMTYYDNLWRGSENMHHDKYVHAWSRGVWMLELVFAPMWWRGDAGYTRTMGFSQHV